MPTLTHYRKLAGYTSIRTFAEAAQQAGIRLQFPAWTPEKGYHTLERDISISIMSQWLQGYYREDLKPDDIAKLLAMLNIPEDQYQQIAEESQEEVQAKWRAKHPVTQEMLAAHEASIKKTADEIYAKMTPEQRAKIHGHAVALGVALPDRRSPLDKMIDQACGIE